ncbi:hypothetical protein B6U83_00110 [Thermoplasmatales archaeon ex4484_36]|nr:MAG: hypothetical protein B6U83_00110 [Thermoplasmatales archaeon ex4484_36]
METHEIRRIIGVWTASHPDVPMEAIHDLRLAFGLETVPEDDGNNVVLRKELGALVEVPVYCGHPRGKNWMAKITPDPASPGGLHRDFFKRAKGKYYYMVPSGSLSPGDRVEFGADYYTGSGRREKKRWYGVVVEDRESVLILREESK